MLYNHMTALISVSVYNLHVITVVVTFNLEIVLTLVALLYIVHKNTEQLLGLVNKLQLLLQVQLLLNYKY